MSLQNIDGFLYQKLQAEGLSQLNAIEKRRKSAKRKCTPKTMQGNDGIGIIMGLQDYDIMEDEEEKLEDHKKTAERHFPTREPPPRFYCSQG